MNRRHLLKTAVLAASATFLVAASAQSTGAGGNKRQKLILQVSDADPGKWNLALNNAKNVQKDLGAANVDVEIVAYGPGIGMLKLDSTVASRVTEATQAGVKVVACENTMHGQKLTKEDMNAAIGYVPAGVTEIMVRQSEGWSYVRP
ncbi:MAG: DsrE family protein [Ramlibacter sp.]|nr:DsrE family protein [Ramlibacter sp.]MCW5648854.1 DsrE family protein [Ramlibacter sp.]